ncbi:MAG: enolase C-terminal domain-like protein [Dongiaceae bacterium]
MQIRRTAVPSRPDAKPAGPRRSPTSSSPIIGCRSIWRYGTWPARIQQGRLDVLRPDVVSVGGITGLRRVCHMANKHNLVFMPRAWGNGIGLLANAHLVAGCASAPYLEFPYDPPQWTIARRDFMPREPVDVDADGWIVLTDRPGLGFDLDEDRLAATLIDWR